MNSVPPKYFMLAGSIFGLLGVAAGAFGAHALKQKLPPETLAVYETAVRYQMYHALALLVIGGMAFPSAQPYTSASGWFFTVGTLIFSGSLYAYVFSGIKIFGAVTPLGGLLLLAGWVCLTLAALRS